MPRRTAWPALASLSRRFSAEFRGDQLAEMFPSGDARDLIRRGILADAGFATSLGVCVCELRRGECDVRVDSKDGAYFGYCNEYGKPVELSADRLQRYGFDGMKWAAWVRLKNGLDGGSPMLGAGALFVGTGAVAGREFGLLIVAPGIRHAADVILPEGVRQIDRPLVALLLGEHVDGLPVDATLPADFLGSDFGTIDTAALERALGQVPLTITPGAAKCLCYSRESRKGRPIDEAEYERLHHADVRREFDVFIDLLLCKVWRKGRLCGTVLDANGRSKRKRLGNRHVTVLADYVKRPGIPMMACDTPTYRGATVEARSAAVLLTEARRSVHGKLLIRSGGRSAKPGETIYTFEPGDTSWCVLDRLPAT